MMKKYKITAKTNGWIAQRDLMFNGKCEVTLDSDLTLQEAQKKLLNMFNEQISEECVYASNWGVAVSMKRSATAYKTDSKGCRRFDYDSRIFQIEEVE